MILTKIVRPVERFFKTNSPTILTSVGVSGTLTTAYLAAKASFKAVRVLDMQDKRDARETLYEFGIETSKRERLIDDTKLVWKFYIPAAASGVLTIVCIVGGAKIGAKRAAAAYSLLTVSEQAFIEYKDKVVETYGAKKEQAVRDAIAQDHVTRNQPSNLVIIGSGNVLCLEIHTGRYFDCSAETLRKAANEINFKCIREMEATLDDFYHMVKLPGTSYSADQGWNADRPMELLFSSAMSPDDRPVLTFEYNYVRPLYDLGYDR